MCGVCVCIFGDGECVCMFDERGVCLCVCACVRVCLGWGENRNVYQIVAAIGGGDGVISRRRFGCRPVPRDCRLMSSVDA